MGRRVVANALDDGMPAMISLPSTCSGQVETRFGLTSTAGPHTER